MKLAKDPQNIFKCRKAKTRRNFQKVNNFNLDSINVTDAKTRAAHLIQHLVKFNCFLV